VPWEDLERTGLWQQHGYSPVSALDMVRALGRVTDSDAQVLTPRPRSNSNWSLSDIFGYDQFPWHTDGALSVNPPRYVAMLLVNSDGSCVPTELLDLGVKPDISSALRRAVLVGTDKQGRKRYLRASEVSDSVRMYRWDPRCCKPTRDRELVERIDLAPPTSSIDWEVGKLVVFDNWRFLHRRPPVPEGSVREIWRCYVRA